MLRRPRLEHYRIELSHPFTNIRSRADRDEHLRSVRREQFVDTEFGPVGIAGDVDQDVAKQPIDEPGRRRFPDARPRHLGKGNLEFVEHVLARFVDARASVVPKRILHIEDENGDVLAERIDWEFLNGRFGSV